jgi:hypothetical protein
MQLAISGYRQFAWDQSGFFTARSLEFLRRIHVNKSSGRVNGKSSQSSTALGGTCTNSVCLTSKALDQTYFTGRATSRRLMRPWRGRGAYVFCLALVLRRGPGAGILVGLSAAFLPPGVILIAPPFFSPLVLCRADLILAPLLPALPASPVAMPFSVLHARGFAR